MLVAAEEKPRTHDAALNWKRLDGLEGVTRVHAPVARDLAMLGQGIEKAGVVVDALLGTGVRGRLREPVRSAVEVIGRARAAGVPVLAVDTPTAVDLTSGEPSDPVVRADLTVTFHRPKTGLQTKIGRALAGRILVAPIGIPRGGRTVPDVRQPGHPRRAAVARGRGRAVVLLAAALTALLPREGQAVVFHTPLLIGVLVLGTAFVLWRILRAPRP